MPKLDVYDLEKNKVGEVDLSDEVFGTKVKEHLFWEVTKQQRACQRRGTKANKNRAQVSGGGAKPYRQKGTGRARQGTTRAPHWVAGGRAFALRPTDYGYRVNKKVAKAAVRSALSLRVLEGKCLVVENLDLKEIKTQLLAATMRKLDVPKALLVDLGHNANAKFSARNLRDFAFLPAEGVGLLDILRYDHLVLTKAAAEKLDGAYKP